MKAFIVFDTLVGVSLMTELTSLREIFVVRQGHHSLLFYPIPQPPPADHQNRYFTLCC